MTLQEYRKIAQAGDVIETNAAGYELVQIPHPFLAEVLRIGSEELLVKWIDPTHIQEAAGIYTVNLSEEFHIRWGNEVATVTIIRAVGEKTATAPKNPKIIREMSIDIRRSLGNVEISIKTPPEVEEYYKKISGNKQKKSQAWFYADNKPAIFYMLNDELNTMEKNIDHEVFSDYGDALVKNGKINTAILRTLGSSKKITIKSGHFNVATNFDIDYYGKRLGLFLKNLWEKSISEQSIKATITYEIQ